MFSGQNGHVRHWTGRTAYAEHWSLRSSTQSPFSRSRRLRPRPMRVERGHADPARRNSQATHGVPQVADRPGDAFARYQVRDVAQAHVSRHGCPVDAVPCHHGSDGRTREAAEEGDSVGELEPGLVERLLVHSIRTDLTGVGLPAEPPPLTHPL